MPGSGRHDDKTCGVVVLLLLSEEWRVGCCWGQTRNGGVGGQGRERQHGTYLGGVTFICKG